jgi:hypothetical protein
MPSGSCLTSKLYDKIIKMPSKSHETIPLNQYLVFLQLNNKIVKYLLLCFPEKIFFYLSTRMQIVPATTGHNNIPETSFQVYTDPEMRVL